MPRVTQFKAVNFNLRELSNYHQRYVVSVAVFFLARLYILLAVVKCVVSKATQFAKHGW